MTAEYDLRIALLNNGYTPLPCRRDTKRPSIRGWPRVAVTRQHIDAWDLLNKSPNTGARQPALDYDFSDPDVCADLEAETRNWLGT